MTLRNAVIQAFEKFPNDQASWFLEQWTQVISGYKNVSEVSFLAEF